MITVIEDYLHTLMSTKIETLKKNPELLKEILKMSEAKLNGLMTYVKNTSIKVTMGYPRTPVDLPCICILLSSANENQEGLGDYGGDLVVNVKDTTEKVSMVNISPNEEKLGFPYVRLTQSIPINSITSITNETTGHTYEEDEYEVINTDRGIIVFYAEGSHDDSILVTLSYRDTVKDGIQVQYENNHRLEVWTNNAEFTVQLYYIAVWALLSDRDNLVSKVGLYRQRLSGSDFQPAPSFFPEFVYRRAITFWCQNTVSVPTDELSYIREIDINQTIEN